MKLGLPMPSTPAVALANGTFLTTGAGVQLVDRLPQRIARIQQNTGNPAITLTFGVAFTPGVICLLGLTCAPGTIISATTGAGGALGGNAAGQAAVKLADGSVACWIVTGNNVATSTVKITLAAAGTFDIGEIAAMPAVDMPHGTDWGYARIDPSISQRSRGGQVITSERRSYRTLRVALTPAALAQVRGGGLAGGMDWDSVVAAITGDKRIAAIPRWLTPVGGIDATELHKTALYGIARPGGTAHLGGNFYGAENGWTMEEVPPL